MDVGEARVEASVLFLWTPRSQIEDGASRCRVLSSGNKKHPTATWGREESKSTSYVVCGLYKSTPCGRKRRHEQTRQSKTGNACMFEGTASPHALEALWVPHPLWLPLALTRMAARGPGPRRNREQGAPNTAREKGAKKKQQTAATGPSTGLYLAGSPYCPPSPPRAQAHDAL